MESQLLDKDDDDDEVNGLWDEEVGSLHEGMDSMRD